jgi:hypothetical protein
MRNILFALIILMILGTAFAENITLAIQPSVTASATPKGNTIASSSENSSGEFYLGLGTGLDLPGNNWDPTYYIGSAADIFCGIGLDNNWALQLDLNQDLFTGNGTNLYNFRGLLDLKYAFSGKGFQPYLLAGSGLVYQSLSPSAANTTNFDGLIGVGIQFEVASKTHLFIETKYNLILSQTTSFTDLPISAGLWVGF